MSDRTNPYSTPREPSSEVHQPSRPTLITFWLLLVFNVAAAYFPAFLWLMLIGKSETREQLFPYSPVCLGCLVLLRPDGILTPQILLAIYFILILGITALLRKSHVALFIMPVTLFLFSLAQGIVFARAFNALDALGHS